MVYEAMAHRIVAAAREGERDVARLCDAAAVATSNGATK